MFVRKLTEFLAIEKAENLRKIDRFIMDFVQHGSTCWLLCLRVDPLLAICEQYAKTRAKPTRSEVRQFWESPSRYSKSKSSAKSLDAPHHTSRHEINALGPM